MGGEAQRGAGSVAGARPQLEPPLAQGEHVQAGLPGALGELALGAGEGGRLVHPGRHVQQDPLGPAEQARVAHEQGWHGSRAVGKAGQSYHRRPRSLRVSARWPTTGSRFHAPS